MQKYSFVKSYDKFHVVKHNFPDMELKGNESQYAVLSKSPNCVYNPRELYNFTATSDKEAIKEALKYATTHNLI